MKCLKPKIKKFPLRMPEEVFKKLEKKSQKSMYSINLLIVEAINKSL